MVPQTPEEWLPVLTKRLDDRMARVTLLRSYVNGQAPLPEMGKNVRESWIAFQRKARRNYGGLAVGSFANRVRARSVRVGADESSPATSTARRVWRDSRMGVQVGQAVWDALSTSVGYLVAGEDDDGGALITAEAPEMFYAEPDPVRPWKARAAVKAWRDPDAGRDYALVWAGGQRAEFTRAATLNGVLLRVNSGGWVPTGRVDTFDGMPVKILDRRGGLALIEPHIDVLDAINLGKLQRLVITAMQAYRQRALKKDAGMGELPEADKDGNLIDWAQVFSPAPGALWDLPEGIDIWESQPADIRQLLEGEKQDARDFAAVTGTPVSVLIPDGENQSASASDAAREQQVQAAADEIERISPAVAGIMVDALRIEGVDLGGETVEIAWQNPAYVSVSERYAAAAQAKAAGESWKSIARNILGYSPDQIAQDAADRAEEQLAAATLVAATQPPAVAGANA